jgi:competence protein ComEC
MKSSRLAFYILILAVITRVYFACHPNFISCQNRSEEGTQETNYYLQEESKKEDLFSRLRNFWLRKTYQFFPSPHSELLLGMTIGIDKLSDVPKFKQMLRETGTIHVVVVSGYNVSLVYEMVIKLLGSPYKTKNVVLGLGTTLFYALLSGFEPPVVRAWLMGSVVSVGKYYGRQFSTLRVLFFTGFLLLVINPSYLYSLSFQLSFLATLSLVLFESGISKKIEKLLRNDSMITEDLSATLAAQILIWPFLAYKFGKVSLISPLVNALILWTVPLATLWGGAFLFLSAVSDPLAKILSYLVFLPLDYFAFLVRIFSKVSWAYLPLKVNLLGLSIYYLAVFLIYFKRAKNAQ